MDKPSTHHRTWQDAHVSIDDATITLRTMNGREFELASDQAPSISLMELGKGIISYIQSHSPQDADHIPHAKDDRAYNFSVCIDDAAPLPWEDSPMIFVDFSNVYKCDIEFAVRSPREIPRKLLAGKLATLLEEYGFNFNTESENAARVDVRKSHDPGLYVWSIEAAIPPSTTIAQICAIRRELNYNSFFFSQSFTDPRMVYELVRTGGIGRLIGMAENEWLEVKSAPYEMKRDKQWQSELSEDVARFANSEYGGILIIGIRSEKREGRDVLKKLTPLPIDGRRVDRYHQSIDSHLHPPVDRLRIESVPYEDGEVVYILVPPQPEERKPFLVQGAFIDGRYQQGVISIVRRRGEHSIPVTAREIHAMLAAGRALLRREANPYREQ
ncbi:AlbA family DNA-binding domain-containing protein [Nonomuraea deserti]|nr:ATP-binding protein [Nonomuraea deserti]